MHAIVELIDGGVAAVWTCATRPDAPRLATECGASGVADRIDARGCRESGGYRIEIVETRTA